MERPGFDTRRPTGQAIPGFNETEDANFDAGHGLPDEQKTDRQQPKGDDLQRGLCLIDKEVKPRNVCRHDGKKDGKEARYGLIGAEAQLQDFSLCHFKPQMTPTRNSRH